MLVIIINTDHVHYSGPFQETCVNQAPIVAEPNIKVSSSDHALSNKAQEIEISDAPHILDRLDSFAACLFLSDSKLPFCNVPLPCFDKNNFELTSAQTVHFKEAMEMVKGYNSLVRQCILKNFIGGAIPHFLFGILSSICSFEATKSLTDKVCESDFMHSLANNACEADYVIDLVPDPSIAIEEVNPKFIVITEYQLDSSAMFLSGNFPVIEQGD